MHGICHLPPVLSGRLSENQRFYGTPKSGFWSRKAWLRMMTDNKNDKKRKKNNCKKFLQIVLQYYIIIDSYTVLHNIGDVKNGKTKED